MLRRSPETVVVTSHVGSASIQTRDRMAETAAANVGAGLDGEDLLNSVLRDAGPE
nr:hypothetical protein [Natrinema amylolyticum]